MRLMPLAILLLSGCAPRSYASRVGYEPLALKLASSGEDPSSLKAVARADELDALTPGRRYKFVVRDDGALVIAPKPADEPHNDWVHPVLAQGGRVRTAGGLRVDGSGGTRRITVDQDSQSYCPSLASLAAAERALAKLGVPPSQIARADRPPACK